MSKNGKDHWSKPASPLPKGATRMERRTATSWGWCPRNRCWHQRKGNRCFIGLNRNVVISDSQSTSTYWKNVNFFFLISKPAPYNCNSENRSEVASVFLNGSQKILTASRRCVPGRFLHLQRAGEVGGHQGHCLQGWDAPGETQLQ